MATITADSGTGTDITESNSLCYCRGTRIRAERGEVAVEELAIGDLLVTRSGALKAVKWIGRREHAGQSLTGNRDLLPVCVRRGALEDGVPARDLWVSPEHALYLDDALVPARHLVNGMSIVQAEAVESVEYFHVELDRHDVIFADGAPAESFVDDDNRTMFHNAAEYDRLYPGEGGGPALYCAPRVEEGLALEAVRRRLAGRARRLGADGVAAPSRLKGHLELVRHDAIEGWAFDPAAPGERTTVVVLLNGAEIGRMAADRHRADLETAGIGDGAHAFSFAIPDGLVADAPLSVELYHAGDWTALQGSPAVLTPAAGGAGAALGTLRGRFETASPERLTGWAQDEADPERAVGLVITANGRLIGEALANRHRADLAAAELGSGRHAFELILPGTLSVLEDQEIRVRRAADGAELPGSPMILPAARGFDGSLRGMLAARLGRLGTGAEEEAALAFLTAQTDRLLARRAARESGAAAREALRLYRRRWGGAAPEDMPAPRPRALVIDDRVPVASRDAGSTAILSHIRALMALGYRVSFAASDEMAGSAALEAEGVSLCAAPYYSCVEEVLTRQRDTFDLVYLHRVSNAENYLALARRHQPRARVVYSVADLHYLRLERQARVEGRPELLAQSRRVAMGERLAAHRADIVLTHSPAEAELLRREINPKKVHVVPFGVAPRTPRPPFAARSGIAFVGSFAHSPNPDAVHYLVREILPRVWQQAPALTCTIVGHGWSQDRLPGLDPRVELAGPVDDLGTVFDRVRLTVAPLRFGAGIKGKVLESFAAGLPCVMTPVAAEGLPLPVSLRPLVADTPAALADAIRRYHADEAANHAAARAATRLVREKFDPAHVIAAVAAALGKPRTARPPTPEEVG